MTGEGPKPEDSEPREGASAADFVRQATHFFTVDLWHADFWRGEGPRLPRMRSVLLRLLRVLVLAVQRFFGLRSLFHASSLTYITILSIVPVLAVAFSMAKGLGAYQRLRSEVITPSLDEYIGPATIATDDAEHSGPGALRSGIDKVVEFVDRTDFSVLGVFASAAMLLTVIKLLSAVERSLNEIWGAHRARSVVRKLSDYLALVILTPVVIVIATGLTASSQTQHVLDKAREIWDFDPLIGLLAPAFSLFVIWIGFTFVYLVMPNARVRFGSALVGGIVGGSLWQGVQVLHVKSQVGMAQYEVLYAGFAAFPILLFWIYLSWVVMLFGAHVAFAHQNESTYRGLAFFRTADQAMREHVGLRLVTRIGQAFVRGEEARNVAELSVRVGAPERLVVDVLGRLARARIVVSSGRASADRYLPARSLDSISVAEVFAAIRHGSAHTPAPVREPVDRVVNEVLDHIEADIEASSANLTLAELVEQANRAEQQG